jgi:hypothetical protein
MRRLIYSIWAGDATRLYGFKFAGAIFRGAHASEACACCIACFLARIVGMVVDTFRVGLPDFDYGVWETDSVTIQHTHREHNTFPFGLLSCDIPHATFFCG